MEAIMSEQSWNNCEWFGELNTCPKSKEELMVEFRRDTSMGEGYQSKFDPSNGPEIDKLFCHTCDSFRARK